MKSETGQTAVTDDLAHIHNNPEKNNFTPTLNNAEKIHLTPNLNLRLTSAETALELDYKNSSPPSEEDTSSLGVETESSSHKSQIMSPICQNSPAIRSSGMSVNDTSAPYLDAKTQIRLPIRSHNESENKVGFPHSHWNYNNWIKNTFFHLHSPMKSEFYDSTDYSRAVLRDPKSDTTSDLATSMPSYPSPKAAVSYYQEHRYRVFQNAMNFGKADKPLSKPFTAMRDNETRQAPRKRSIAAERLKVDDDKIQKSIDLILGKCNNRAATPSSRLFGKPTKTSNRRKTIASKSTNLEADFSVPCDSSPAVDKMTLIKKRNSCRSPIPELYRSRTNDFTAQDSEGRVGSRKSLLVADGLVGGGSWLGARVGGMSRDSYCNTPKTPTAEDSMEYRDFEASPEYDDTSFRFYRTKTIHILPSCEELFEGRRAFAQLQAMCYRPNSFLRRSESNASLYSDKEEGVTSQMDERHTVLSPELNSAINTKALDPTSDSTSKDNRKPPIRPSKHPNTDSQTPPQGSTSLAQRYTDLKNESELLGGNGGNDLSFNSFYRNRYMTRPLTKSTADDICNSADTTKTKTMSELSYTFEDTVDYADLYMSQFQHTPAPHATYSLNYPFSLENSFSLIPNDEQQDYNIHSSSGLPDPLIKVSNGMEKQSFNKDASSPSNTGDIHFNQSIIFNPNSENQNYIDDPSSVFGTVGDNSNPTNPYPTSYGMSNLPLDNTCNSYGNSSATMAIAEDAKYKGDWNEVYRPQDKMANEYEIYMKCPDEQRYIPKGNHFPFGKYQGDMHDSSKHFESNHYPTTADLINSIQASTSNQNTEGFINATVHAKNTHHSGYQIGRQTDSEVSTMYPSLDKRVTPPPNPSLYPQSSVPASHWFNNDASKDPHLESLANTASRTALTAFTSPVVRAQGTVQLNNEEEGHDYVKYLASNSFEANQNTRASKTSSNECLETKQSSIQNDNSYPSDSKNENQLLNDRNDQPIQLSSFTTIYQNPHACNEVPIDFQKIKSLGPRFAASQYPNNSNSAEAAQHSSQADTFGALTSATSGFETISPSTTATSPEADDKKSVRISSLGATHHPNNCKPCAFVWTKGCTNGKNCQFCHEWHLPKKKKPMKDQKNLMIIARPDGKIEFLRCTIDEALRVCY